MKRAELIPFACECVDVPHFVVPSKCRQVTGNVYVQESICRFICEAGVLDYHISYLSVRCATLIR